MDKNKFLTLNLNTVFSGVAVLLVIAALSNGWTLNTNMVKVQITQDAMAKALEAFTKTVDNLMPRAELELRLRSYDKDIAEVRSKQQSLDLEIIKLRDRK